GGGDGGRGGGALRREPAPRRDCAGAPEAAPLRAARVGRSRLILPERAARYAPATVRLCMFSPLDRELERGWPGLVEGDRVIQLAAQTLQSFFTGGGTARHPAGYPRHRGRFLPPVQPPPAVA